MPPLEGEDKTRIGPVLGAGLMGLFLGGGIALLIAALARSDLDFHKLAGGDGLAGGRDEHWGTNGVAAPRVRCQKTQRAWRGKSCIIARRRIPRRAAAPGQRLVRAALI